VGGPSSWRRSRREPSIEKKRGEVMKSRFPALLAVSLAAIVVAGPGCAISDLKNTNRRLKEANDRLVSENNRLEQELAAAEKEAAEKAKRLDSMQSEMDQAKTAPEPVETAKPGPAAPGDDFSDIPEIELERTPRGTLLRLEDRVFFSQGQAQVSKRGEAILQKVASRLNSRYRANLIRVEGHTDDVQPNRVKKQYPSNWELSTARACSVVRYLVERGGLKPNRIYPAGFSSYKPIASARTASARSQNRRVEILILNERA
jgi:flagellar motor protein MotB